MRQGFCGAITDLRGHACADERANDLTRDTLNGTAADATLSSDFQHTLRRPAIDFPDSLFSRPGLSVACQAAYPQPRPALARP